jgi:hypothetical protein
MLCSLEFNLKTNLKTKNLNLKEKINLKLENPIPKILEFKFFNHGSKKSQNLKNYNTPLFFELFLKLKFFSNLCINLKDQIHYYNYYKSHFEYSPPFTKI